MIFASTSTRRCDYSASCTGSSITTTTTAVSIPGIVYH